MRWWRLALGGALLAWVLGTAYLQARRRGRRIGASLLLSGAALLLFAVASLVPRPPVSDQLSGAMVIGSIALLALAAALLLWQGFRR